MILSANTPVAMVRCSLSVVSGARKADPAEVRCPSMTVNWLTDTPMQSPPLRSLGTLCPSDLHASMNVSVSAPQQVLKDTPSEP